MKPCSFFPSKILRPIAAGPPDLVRSGPASSGGRGGAAFGFVVSSTLGSWLVTFGGVGMGVKGVLACVWLQLAAG